MTKDEVTVKLEKTKCCYCGSDFVTAEQHDANFTRYKHESWVGLTDEDWNRSKHSHDFQKGVDWAEQTLKGKNT